MSKFGEHKVNIGRRETPPVKIPPKPDCSVMPRQSGKSKTTLFWILEYLKVKYPEDKDAIDALIQVAMEEM